MFNRQYEAMSVRSPDISGGETWLAKIKGEPGISENCPLICPNGGIGRHVALKKLCREACEIVAHFGYQMVVK